MKKYWKRAMCMLLILAFMSVFATIVLAEGEPVTTPDGLADAVNSAENGETIVLGGDITLESDQPVKIKNKDIIIDGNGVYTVAAAVYGGNVLDFSGSSVTLLNVVIEGTVFIRGASDIEIQDCTVNGSINVSNGAQLTVNEGSAIINDIDAAAVIVSGTSIMDVSGGSINGEQYGILASGGSTVNVSGGSVIGGQYGILGSGWSVVNAISGTIRGGQQGIRDDDNTCSVHIDRHESIDIIREDKPENAAVMKLVLTGGTPESRKSLSTDPDGNDYDIDIPADPSDDSGSTYLIAPDFHDPANAVVDVKVISMYINGSGGKGGDGVDGVRKINFRSELGAIVLNLEVKLSYEGVSEETREITLNLFQPHYKGITVTPDMVTDSGTLSADTVGVTHVGYKDGEDAVGKPVFFGADTVSLTLPDSDNNRVKGFIVTSVEGDGASYSGVEGSNNYTVTLSSSLTAYTIIYITIELSDSGEDTEDIRLVIEEVAITENGGKDENDNFSTSAYYHTASEFYIDNPHMLIVYYNDVHQYGDEDNKVDYDDPRDKEVVKTKVVALHDYDEEIFLAEGNVEENIIRDMDGDEIEANIASVFLVSGEITAGADMFGGVQYAYEGMGWTDVLSNHPVMRNWYRNGGEK